MLIILKRTYKAGTTEGELFIDGELVATTLEDIGRPYGVKVPKATCIPEGEYKIAANDSQRFKRRMPVIYSNPKTLACEHGGIVFTGIRIHAGSATDHTEGCILVEAKVLPSLEARIIKAVDSGEDVTLRVIR